jgi:PBP1b-binding outer membrane lipoprotein LpoB
MTMKTIHHLILLTCLAQFCTSCAKQESPAPEPVKEAPKKIVKPKAKASTATVAAATNLFRTPSDDIALPTDAQIAEGEQPAAVKPPAQPNYSSPSISIKPPAGNPSSGKP